MSTPEPLAPGLHLMDCMEGMRRFPDGYFDLAIVDPPYGDGNANIGGEGTLRRMVRPIQGGGTGSASASTATKWNRFAGGDNLRPISRGGGTARTNTASGGAAARTGGTWAGKYGKKIIAWDVAPGKDYFTELFRVSREQIIWGGNYFDLPPTRCFLVWDKTIPENFSMAMCEYAWTSLKGNAKLYKCAPQGTRAEPRFHPTQKPVALYSWILGRFAKAGMRILDTHAGSGSCLVACHRAGLDAWGFEIDPVYCEKAQERLERERAQTSLFTPEAQAPDGEQTTLF